MADIHNNNSVVIIGAGFAGLAAGIYAQMNGYKSQIFEMHDVPGGLCTSWKRRGYTIDACIHWLVGSSPEAQMHDLWEEVGVVQGREFIYMDEYMHIETPDGRTLTFYTDIDRLEKHLLEFSPVDAEPIRDFIKGIRMCLSFDQPSKRVSWAKRMMKRSSLIFSFMRNGKVFQQWMKTTASDFAKRFKNPVLRRALEEMWLPEFSMFFMLFTFAYLHTKNAGYPLGGSMPMSKALEKRYLDLGGIINYNKRVDKILTDNDSATGIRLTDGKEYSSNIVISAADGYNTIFKMLDGRYTDEKIKEIYDKWHLFPPLIFIGMGVNRKFDEIPFSVSGFSFPLEKPVVIGDRMRERLSVHLYHHDPSMAPEGRTAMTLMFETDYDYWKKLYENRRAYEEKKDEIAKTIVDLLEQRFPGISSQVEMIDVATPLTFERYTGNWKGSFEGWLITPDNSNVVMKPMSQTLPGLRNFYMCGQWVEPGGGLPTGIMSARRLLKRICKEEGKKFRTATI
ncbi:MAG: NAD(P)/FAD-dependent oxidoreductase [Bacteroidota bacterium]|nr:NAD(P)/FAD-dependent oxidoreductase [Bacteroidota bacterium]